MCSSFNGNLFCQMHVIVNGTVAAVFFAHDYFNHIMGKHTLNACS